MLTPAIDLIRVTAPYLGNGAGIPLYEGCGSCYHARYGAASVPRDLTVALGLAPSWELVRRAYAALTTPHTLAEHEAVCADLEAALKGS